jgi:hypothetical protein
MAATVQSISRALRRSVALAADLCLPTAVSRNLNWRRPMTRAVRKAFVLRQLSSWNSAAVWVGEPSQFARGRRRQAQGPPAVKSLSLLRRPLVGLRIGCWRRCAHRVGGLLRKLGTQVLWHKRCCTSKAQFAMQQPRKRQIIGALSSDEGALSKRE